MSGSCLHHLSFSAGTVFLTMMLLLFCPGKDVLGTELEDIRLWEESGDSGRLIEVLGEPDAKASELAANALERLGEPLGRLMHDSLNGSLEAAEKLAERNDPRAVTTLFKILGYGNSERRQAAAKLLGMIGDPKAVDPLIQSLEHPNVAVMLEAIIALDKLADPRAVDPLINLTGHMSDQVRTLAATTLTKLNQPLGQLIYDSLEGSLEATEALAKLQDPRALSPHIRFLQHWDLSRRVVAARALGKLKDPGAIEPLKNAFDSAGWELRKASTDALVEIGGNSLFDFFIEKFHNSSGGARSRALRGLRKIKDHRAFDLFVGALDDYDPSIRKEAALALGRMKNKRAVEPLIKTLDDNMPNVRIGAAWALRSAYKENPRVIEHLIRALGDKHETVRNEVAIILDKIEEPLGKLVHESLQGSREAQKKLANSRDQRAIVPLIQALVNPDMSVRWAAATTLGKLKNDTAVDDLVKMANRWNPLDRIYAVTALARIKQKSYSDNLHTLSNVLFGSFASIVYCLFTLCLFGVVTFLIIRVRALKDKEHHVFTNIGIKPEDKDSNKAHDTL